MYNGTIKDNVRTLVVDKAESILKELKEGNKLYAIKELKPKHYAVDQALILDPKEFSKDEIVKLFQLSIALNKGIVQIANTETAPKS